MKRLPFIFLVLLLIASCKFDEVELDNIKGPVIDGDFALSVGELSYTIRELLEELEDTKLELHEDSTSLIYLLYTDSAYFDAASELVNISDIVSGAYLELPTVAPVVADTTISIDSVYTFTYQPDDDEMLDSVFYATGNLNLDVSTTVGNNLNYTFAVQNTVNVSNDQAIMFSGSLAGSAGDFQSQPLAGHKTFLFRKSDGRNAFRIHLTLDIPLATGQAIAPGQTVDFTVSYTDQAFSLLYGKFGQDTLQVGNEVIDVAFFEDMGSSGLRLGSPVVTLTCDNSFGLDMGLLLGGLYGIKGEGPAADTTYLTGDITETPQVIQGPGLDEIGQTVRTTITVDNTNSSIASVLSASPDRIGLTFSSVANPEDPAQQNFALGTSSISTHVELMMPLEIQLENLTRSVEFGLGDGINIKEADSLVVRVVSNNELPFSGVMDLEIRDENDSLTYLSAGNLILEFPFMDNDGYVTRPRKNIQDVILTSSGVEALKTGKKIVLRLTLNTPPSLRSRNIYAKILANYRLDLKLSVVAGINVKL